MSREKIVFFMLLGLGAAALAAEQSSVTAPAQEAGANRRAPKPRQNHRTPVRGPASAYPERPPADPAAVSAATRFSAPIAVSAMDPMPAVAKAAPI